VIDLIEAKSRINSMIGDAGDVSSDIRAGILKAVGDPRLRQEQYVKNVILGMVLSVGVIDAMIAERQDKSAKG
jgi:hypothetical protein